MAFTRSVDTPHIFHFTTIVAGIGLFTVIAATLVYWFTDPGNLTYACFLFTAGTN